MTHPIPGADSERLQLDFEQWALENGISVDRFGAGFGRGYYDPDQKLWLAYKAGSARAAAKVGANVAADEGAISAAMSEGNKHGVKSFVAAKIVAAYLAAGTPAETPKPAAAAQMPTDDEVWEKCISVKPESFEQGPDDAMDFKKYDAAVVRAYLAAQPAPAPKNRSE